MGRALRITIRPDDAARRVLARTAATVALAGRRSASARPIRRAGRRGTKHQQGDKDSDAHAEPYQKATIPNVHLILLSGFNRPQSQRPHVTGSQSVVVHSRCPGPWIIAQSILGSEVGQRQHMLSPMASQGTGVVPAFATAGFSKSAGAATMPASANFINSDRSRSDITAPPDGKVVSCDQRPWAERPRRLCYRAYHRRSRQFARPPRRRSTGSRIAGSDRRERPRGDPRPESGSRATRRMMSVASNHTARSRRPTPAPSRQCCSRRADSRCRRRTGDPTGSRPRPAFHEPRIDDHSYGRIPSVDAARGASFPAPQ